MTSVFFSREDGLLCLYRIGSRVANGKYVGAAGGHFEKEELDDPESCALRELREELGITAEEVADLRLRYVTVRYINGEIRQNYYFFGSLNTDRKLQSNEGNLRFASWQELETLEMPLSARQMMDHYLKIGRFTQEMYAGITEPGGARFVRLESFE